MSARIVLLCRHDPGSVVGISSGSTPDELLATVRGDGVIAYSTASQGQSRGWGAGRQEFQFSTAAVYSSMDGAYYVAASTRPPGAASILLTWPAATSGMLDRVAQRVALPKPAHAIHPVMESAAEQRSQGEASSSETALAGVFVLFTDGTAAVTGRSGNGSPPPSCGPSGQRALCSCVCGGQLAAVSRGANEGLSLSLFSLQAGELQWDGSTRLAPPAEGAVLSRVLLAGCKVSLLWVDGTLQVLRLLPCQTEGELVLQPHIVRKLSGYAPQPIIRAKQNGKTGGSNGKRKSGTATAVHQPPSTLVCLPHDQVAVVGCPSDVGAGQELHVAVVDTLYGTLCGCDHLGASKLLAAIRAGTQQQLQAVHLEEASLLVVLLHGALLLCPLQTKPVNLAALLGAQRTAGDSQNLAFTALPPAHRPNRVVWLQRHDNAAALSIRLRADAAVPLLHRDAEGELVNVAHVEEGSAEDDNAEAVSSALAAELDAPETFASSRSATVYANRVMQAADSVRFGLPADLLAQILLRCVEKELWGPAERIIGSGRVGSVAGAPGLLPLVAARHQHRLLARLLPQARNAALADVEGLLVVLLGDQCAASRRQWYDDLRQQAEQAVERCEAAGTADFGADTLLAIAAVDGFSTKEAELHAALAMPLDGAVLLAALHRVDPPDALFLARYLTKWLLRHNSVLHSNKRLAAPSGCVVPGLANVLQWACALLDAHLVGLALLPSARPVMEGLARAVALLRRSAYTLSALAGAMQHLRSQAPLPLSLSASAASYSVELLDLHVVDC